MTRYVILTAKGLRRFLHDAFCQSCKRKITASKPLFDPVIYREQLSTYSFGHIAPVTHYLLVGRFRGYKVTDQIDCAYCADRYGVNEADVVCDYIFKGRYEGWQTLPTLDTSVSKETRDFLQHPVKGKARYAVALHLYHYDLWEEFETYIAHIYDDADLYVNLIDHGHDLSEIKKKVLARFPDATIVVFPNHGRDILPFMQLVKSGVFDSYSAVFKLHTKKSRAAEKWRERLVGAILHDRDHARGLLKQMENCGVGLIGSELDINGGFNLWKNNIDGVKGLARQLELEYSDFESYPDFLAGSIFLIRGDVIRLSKGLEFSSEDWPPEAGQQDGTLGHQLERLFSILCYEKGLEIHGVASLPDKGLN